MMKKLVLVAVGAMLVLNVSARDVRKSKGSFRRDIRIEDARQMKRFESDRCKDARFKDARFREVRFRDARFKDFRPCDCRKAPQHRARHHKRW